MYILHTFYSFNITLEKRKYLRKTYKGIIKSWTRISASHVCLNVMVVTPSGKGEGGGGKRRRGVIGKNEVLCPILSSILRQLSPSYKKEKQCL